MKETKIPQQVLDTQAFIEAERTPCRIHDNIQDVDPYRKD